MKRLMLLCLLPAGLLLPSTATALEWKDCGNGFQCATATVPLDYAEPHGRTLDLAVTRLPARDPSRRIGSLFVNFGGPGAPGVESLKGGSFLFESLKDRFDLVGFDPRGVGESEGAIDCKTNQEELGVYAQPFATPENLDAAELVARSQRYVRRCLDLNREILPYVSTANVARDMDRLREAVGDGKLSYLGYSYGTFLGATYASLFPHRYRALVLDGPIDADEYINRPLEYLREQSAGLERGLARFFQKCAARQEACGFGAGDPLGAFDELAERLDREPLPIQGADPRPVDGDDLRAAAMRSSSSPWSWNPLAFGLERAVSGDGSVIRLLTNSQYGRRPDGTYDPLADRYFTISALEQDYAPGVRTYLEAGNHSWGLFDHFWFNSGYFELPFGLYPVKPRGVFRGPFRASASAPPALVVGTTYDPVTPYGGARRLAAQLGNARLLTMRGDGHTAYGAGLNSSCIDAAVDAYLEDGTIPPAGTTCRQRDIPFGPPPDAAAARKEALVR